MSSGTGKTIYTIGIGTRTVEEVAYILRAYKIGAVADVRANPIGAEWDRGALEKSLPTYGVAYMWMGKELGLPSGQTDLDRIERTPIYGFGIAQLSRVVARYAEGAPDLPYVAILSAEADPDDSPREHLIARTLRDSDWTVRHIRADGTPG